MVSFGKKNTRVTCQFFESTEVPPSCRMSPRMMAGFTTTRNVSSNGLNGIRGMEKNSYLRQVLVGSM